MIQNVFLAFEAIFAPNIFGGFIPHWAPPPAPGSTQTNIKCLRFAHIRGSQPFYHRVALGHPVLSTRTTTSRKLI